MFSILVEWPELDGDSYCLSKTRLHYVPIRIYLKQRPDLLELFI